MVQALRPFVPARDFALSKRFYETLGFAVADEFQGGAILAIDGHSFLLQDFYVKDWAGNFVMQMVVDDLDETWRRIEAAKLGETFNVRDPIPPKEQPWGLVVGYVFDPSGVLWHVTEFPTA